MSQNNSQPAGFAAALRRAKLVAGEIEGRSSASKRPLEEGTEPSAKKLASIDPAYQQQDAAMSANAAAAAAAANTAAAPRGGRPAGPPGPSGLMQDQTIKEYIRASDKMLGLGLITLVTEHKKQIARLFASAERHLEAELNDAGPKLATALGLQKELFVASYDFSRKLDHFKRKLEMKDENTNKMKSPLINTMRKELEILKEKYAELQKEVNEKIELLEQAKIQNQNLKADISAIETEKSQLLANLQKVMQESDLNQSQTQNIIIKFRL